MQDPPTRVTFYVLEATDPTARLDFACRLAEKAYRLRHRVHAHLESSAMAREFDERLWTFRQGSFVPHEILGDAPPESPVTIGISTEPAGGGDVLINLGREVPAFYRRFARVTEIIDGTADGRQAGRTRHQHYRQAGLAPETRRIDGTDRD